LCQIRTTAFCRGSGKDRDDADFWFRSQKLDAQLLRERYEKELLHNLFGNVEWHDGTRKLWIEILGKPHTRILGVPGRVRRQQEFVRYFVP
jgi:hypothetical protein